MMIVAQDPHVFFCNKSRFPHSMRELPVKLVAGEKQDIYNNKIGVNSKKYLYT